MLHIICNASWEINQTNCDRSITPQQKILNKYSASWNFKTGYKPKKKYFGPEPIGLQAVPVFLLIWSEKSRRTDFPKRILFSIFVSLWWKERFVQIARLKRLNKLTIIINLLIRSLLQIETIYCLSPLAQDSGEWLKIMLQCGRAVCKTFETMLTCRHSELGSSPSSLCG